MLTCAMRIRRHISGLPRDQIFTSGDLLHCGSRAAIDQAVKRMIQCEEICRLARGVFVRDGTIKPSVLAVATAKAKRFGKQIVDDCSDVHDRLGLVSDAEKFAQFAVSGRSSSFKYGDIQVQFKGVSARKAQLAETGVGRVMRTLWERGRNQCIPELIQNAMREFRRHQFKDLGIVARWAPAWLISGFRSALKLPNLNTTNSNRHVPTSPVIPIPPSPAILIDKLDPEVESTETSKFVYPEPARDDESSRKEDYADDGPTIRKLRKLVLKSSIGKASARVTRSSIIDEIILSNAREFSSLNPRDFRVRRPRGSCSINRCDWRKQSRSLHFTDKSELQSKKQLWRKTSDVIWLAVSSRDLTLRILA